MKYSNLLTYLLTYLGKGKNISKWTNIIYIDSLRIITEKSHTWDQDRIVASFRIEKPIWIEFDQYVTEHYGNYKKSIIIESLIKKFLKSKQNREPFP